MAAPKSLVRLTRLANTRTSGNPRWRLHFADGTAIETAPDAAVNYAISEDLVGQEFLVETNDKGQIIGVTL